MFAPIETTRAYTIHDVEGFQLGPVFGDYERARAYAAGLLRARWLMTHVSQTRLGKFVEAFLEKEDLYGPILAEEASC